MASELRQNQTEAETILFSYLRAHQLCGIHFRKQHPIGRYVVDFCAARKKLIIELDGSPHNNRIKLDNERSAYLKAHNFRVLRFWNHGVLSDIDGVVKTIKTALSEG